MVLPRRRAAATMRLAGVPHISRKQVQTKKRRRVSAPDLRLVENDRSDRHRKSLLIDFDGRRDLPPACRRRSDSEKRLKPGSFRSAVFRACTLHHSTQFSACQGISPSFTAFLLCFFCASSSVESLASKLHNFAGAGVISGIKTSVPSPVLTGCLRSVLPFGKTETGRQDLASGRPVLGSKKDYSLVLSRKRTP